MWALWRQQRHVGATSATGHFRARIGLRLRPRGNAGDAMQLSNKPALISRVYDVDDFAAAQELYHSSGWTDGLPVVPPTQAAVEACLEWAAMPPNQLLGIEPVRAQPITAEKLAINAVMAGCLPMHFPVVATAWQAMMQDEFLLHGVTLQHRRVRRPRRSSTGRSVSRSAPVLDLQRARQQRSRHCGHRPGAAAGADQPARRAPRRHRPLHARPSRQVLLLPGRGRGGHDLGAAVGGARHAARACRPSP